MEQADLEAEIEPEAAHDEVIDIFLTCATQAMPFFSSQIETTPFVKFACEKFFPLSAWKFIGATEGDPAQTQLRLLKVFAELCGHCGTLEKAKEKIETIYSILLEFLPPPPADLENMETPSILFSHVECLLYSIHALGKQCPEFLAFASEDEKLKDFRNRLQFLSRNTQGYVKKLQDEIKAGKVSKDPKTDEEKLKVIGLMTTSNIQTLIRDLYQSSYKAVVRLSWVPVKTKNVIKVDNGNKEKETETLATTATKRHAPITFSNGDNKKSDGARTPKQARHSSQQVYSPPSGKFSSKFNNSQRGGGGGGGGGGTGRNFNQRNRFNNNSNKRQGGGFNRNRR